MNTSLTPLSADRLVGGGGGDRVDRDRDDDVGLLGHHGLDVGDLLLRLEAGVGDGDDLDAFGGELRLERGFLRVRPVVAAVVEHERGRRMLGLHLGEFIGRERDARRRGYAFSPFGPVEKTWVFIAASAASGIGGVGRASGRRRASASAEAGGEEH